MLASFSTYAATVVVMVENNSDNFSSNTFRATPSGPWQGMVGSTAVSNTPQTSLSAKAAGVALSIYPNPSKGLVVVTLNQKVGPEYKLRLSNVLGREIRSFALRTEASNTGMPLNLSDLPAGMYFYSLVLNDKVVSTKRFVLQN